MRVLRPVFYFVFALLLALIAFNFFYPFTPIADRTETYDRRVYLSWGFPFLVRYYLLEPEDYDPDRDYPLVVVLHGASKNAYAAYVLADDRMRADYPAFVAVPMAPVFRTWALPNEPEFQEAWFPAIGLAANIATEVADEFSIDPDRIYVTGTSTGGFGTFAAPIEYPDLFAAAVPIAGGWTTKDADRFPDIAVWAWHDRDDDQVSAHYTRDFVSKLRINGVDARYSEVTGYGHGSWRAAYQDPALWRWLFSQSR